MACTTASLSTEPMITAVTIQEMRGPANRCWALMTTAIEIAPAGAYLSHFSSLATVA